MNGYPTLEQVGNADVYNITRWLRFLPSPVDEDRPVMDAIIAKRGTFTDAERVRASKDVGWDR